MYCSKRALDLHTEEAAKKNSSSSSKSKSKEIKRTAEGDRIVNEVMEAFMSGLGRGDVDTNIFATPVSLKVIRMFGQRRREMQGEKNLRGGKGANLRKCIGTHC